MAMPKPYTLPFHSPPTPELNEPSPAYRHSPRPFLSSPPQSFVKSSRAQSHCRSTTFITATSSQGALFQAGYARLSGLGDHTSSLELVVLLAGRAGRAVGLNLASFDLLGWNVDFCVMLYIPGGYRCGTSTKFEYVCSVGGRGLTYTAYVSLAIYPPTPTPNHVYRTMPLAK
ncbi:hypothetical protein BDQ17DRAFT_1428919 [Cyathus striatus]|nr:hypothetical protein BDQ17DRAFT_1428919 [Cyathus striatus]